MKIAILTTTLSASLFTQGAYSWGAMGHATVAYIAQNYMNGAARIFTSHLLNGATLVDVASWADSFRYTKDGRFSAGYHYIDAHDDVPHKCSIDLKRDCGPEGCIVSAIANYTARAMDEKLSTEERTDALKFIVHFLGDITQPLHTENLDVGGNEISVKWGDASSKTNLHAIWDKNIPETLAGGSTTACAESFAKAIIADIEAGIYKDEKAQWNSCTSIDATANCPKEWATDTNKFVCSVVMPDGVDAVEGKDLSSAYYQKVSPTVRQQLAKGGYRLGAWLNAMAKAGQ
ncbi:hypothetical protein ABW20_dc0108479 [Dactylellina cionopaga]|nr:hypothetical protein ABW20_dc0108479 [Dactylellina cionopaga]